MRKSVNVVNHNAPYAMHFYGSPFADPADPIVAPTTAMYTGESLGLGTCMPGSVHPMIQYGRSGWKFREKHGIKYASREGVFVIFGHSSVEYKTRIRRNFASTKFMN